MKKIIIAFDGTNFSDGAFEFARQLNERQPVLVAGIFIPQVSYANLWSYTGAMAGPAYVPMVGELDAEAVERNIEKFETLCQRNGMPYRVHKDFFDFALPELRRETRFADLMIISSEKFYSNLVGEGGDEYMKDALHESECPVIVIPETFEFPTRNVIAYDATASSVFALKQFAYLFPELADNETLLVHCKNEEEKNLPHERYVEELATQHYRNLNLVQLDINPKKYFNTWIREETNPILISGAFGRSVISQMFRKSFISAVIAEHKIPVFIAHR